MSDKQGSNIPWWAIVLGFMFFPPVGMVLLFLSLAGVRIPLDSFRRSHTSAGENSYTACGPSQQRPQTPPPTTSAPAAYSGQSRSFSAKQPQQSAANKRYLFHKLKGGKAFTIIGAVMSFFSLMGLLDEWITFGFSDVSYWFPGFGFFCAGIFMLATGISRTRLSRRQRLYMGVIGQRSSVFISDLAGMAGVSEKRVISDLQKMLSEGILPMGYIDRATNRLVLTDQGYEAPPPKKEEPRKTPEDKSSDILHQIRSVNDAIPDAEMSRKIDRIEEITGKILDYQRRNPTKNNELRQFLNYYLPTTLKILNAYAQMDAQGVAGENISAAKERIEGMMDKVVEGFEKQLDQLFKSDAMDIAADVEVLERMLDKDGLGSGMTMGQ